MRRPAVAFGVVFAAGLVLLIVLGLTRGSDLAYSPGVLPGAPLIPLKPGDRACQGPIRLPSGTAFDRVVFSLGTYHRTGTPMRVVVRDLDSGLELASARLPGGYPDIAQAPQHVVRLDSVETTDPIEVCLLDDGARPVAVYGQAGFASPTTTATLNGTRTNVDMAITLRRGERSLLALAPEMAERASRFRAGWVTPGVYAVLALLVLVGAPLLLARGLARAAADDG